MNNIKIGQDIKLIYDLPNKKALCGCVAFVVDKESFTNSYMILRENLKNKGSLDLLDDFIFIIWDKNDKNYNGAEDGAYFYHSFSQKEQWLNFKHMILKINSYLDPEESCCSKEECSGSLDNKINNIR